MIASRADPERDALERAIGTQYEIVRLIGRGGMGAVYLARERALERAVAVKVLPPDAAGNDSRERFRREARTAANLTHPNIVPLYTFGDAEGMLFFVMGYVKGEPLAARMAREGILPADDVRRILSDLASALDYAHRQGVVHRDIKPDNVLLDEESGRPMLTDFGVSKAGAHGATLTEVGTIVGTPHYMSPEQASGERDLDGRSDLYSLGVMGYAMIAGRLPFEGGSFRDIIVQHVTKEPAPLAVLAPEAPRDITMAITRCLAKSPESRWVDGQSFRNALLAGDDDEVELSRPEAAMRGAAPVVGTLLLADIVFAGASYVMPALRIDAGTAWFQAPLFIAGMLALLVGVTAVTSRSRGASWQGVRKNALLPPRWWPTWYPRAWRAVEDVGVSNRLPIEAKKMRMRMNVAWAAVATAAAVTLARMTMRIDSSLEGVPWTSFVTLTLAGTGMGLMLWTIHKAVKWGAARGLSQMEAQKFVFGPTADFKLWRKEKFAALLLPHRVGGLEHATAPEPQSPEQLVCAIEDIAEKLTGPSCDLACDSLSAARSAVGAIIALDAEIAVLVQDASPHEIVALDAKLSALGDATNEPSSRRELREMLSRQRELFLRLTAQLDHAVSRRGRLLVLIRTLWLQVANLRAAVARDTMADAETTGKIRSAIAELNAGADAWASVQLETAVTHAPIAAVRPLPT